MFPWPSYRPPFFFITTFSSSFIYFFWNSNFPLCTGHIIAVFSVHGVRNLPLYFVNCHFFYHRLCQKYLLSHSTCKWFHFWLWKGQEHSSTPSISTQNLFKFTLVSIHHILHDRAKDLPYLKTLFTIPHKLLQVLLILLWTT